MANPNDFEARPAVRGNHAPPRPSQARQSRYLPAVLWQRVRSGNAGRCLLLGLLFLIAGGCRTPNPAIRDLASAVSRQRLQDHVEALCKDGPRAEESALRNVRSYLGETLRAMGYEPMEETFSWTSTMTVTDRKSGQVKTVTSIHEDTNLLVTKRGVRDPGIIVEVAAHFDTVAKSPGADDNASGVAAVLEIARVLAGQSLNKTVRFCFFAKEELFLIGSRKHVERFASSGDRVEGALVLDGIGYASTQPGSQDAPIRIPLIAWLPETGNFVLDVGNFDSGWLGNLFEGCVESYAPELAYYSANRIGGFFRDGARSDHAAYWDVGIPGILVTDTGNFRNPHYHRETDTPATLDYRFLTQVTQATAATMAEWAEISDQACSAARATRPLPQASDTDG